MVMREEVPSRLSWCVLLAAGVLAALALPAWTVGQVGPAVPVVVEDPNLTPQPAAAAPAADRERQIRDLEKKIEALLKELKALRSGAGPGAQPAQAVDPLTAVPYVGQLFRVTQAAEAVHAVNPYSVPLAAEGEVMLTRATYTLPAGKAAALAAFLRDNVKASVLETKVDGDHLVVTTTPDVQHVVRHFIELMQGKRPAPAGAHGLKGA
jgi:hypothetical protein